MDEAETDAIIALLFFYQILHFDPISPRNEIFGRFSTGLQKFRLKIGFNMGTLIISNTPKPTIYAFGRRLLLLCLQTEYKMSCLKC